MIEVFQTNVRKKHQSKLLIGQLMQIFPESKVNFDLNDCDKILRIENEIIDSLMVIQLLEKNGFACKRLI